MIFRALIPGLLSALLIGTLVVAERARAVIPFTGGTSLQYVRSILGSTTITGNSCTTNTFTAIQPGHTIIGFTDIDQPATSVTDNRSNTYTRLGSQAWGTSAAFVTIFYLTNIQGSPTTLTFNAAASPTFCGIAFDEYVGNAGVNMTTGPTEVDGTNPSISLTPTADGVLLWELISSGAASQPTMPSGFTLRQNNFATQGQISAEQFPVSRVATSATWTQSGGFGNVLGAVALK